MKGTILDFLEDVERKGDIKDFKTKISRGKEGWLRPACISHLKHGLNVTQAEAEDVIDLFVKGCEPGVLTRDNNGVGNDYVLKEGADSAWIRIDNIVVWVHRMDDGVSTELFPVGHASSETLDSAYATFVEADGFDEEDEEETVEGLADLVVIEKEE